MRPPPRCNANEHTLSRRLFLAGAAGLAGLAGFPPAAALSATLSAADKRVLLLFQHGGISQFESWDPKPGTEFGGPFGAIASSIAGVHVSELLPHTAQQMHHLTVLRGLNTADDNHDSARVRMLTGWSQGFVGGQYPSLGAVCTKLLADGRPEPPYVLLTDREHWYLAPLLDASFLGPACAPLVAFDQQPPEHLEPPAALGAARAARLAELRRRVAEQGRVRATPQTDAYRLAFDKAARLAERKGIFDLSQEPARDHERYGRHAFGQRCLLARRLLEQGTTFVTLNHLNYDAHFENFDNHLWKVGEFDRPFAALIADLAERGLLETTLVVVMGEFGRTPQVNSSIGRDHWSKSWSMVMAGCGLKAGLVHGRTNDQGTEVAEGQVGAFDLFHTFYRALGLDPAADIYNGDQPLKLTDPAGKPVAEVLA